MDTHGQLGPEKGDYEADVARVARGLLEWGAAYVPIAHLGTRLNLVLALRDKLAIPGGDPEGQDDGPWAFVAVVEHGAYWFRLDQHAAGHYAADKLGVSVADGNTISGFLMTLWEALSGVTAASR